MNYFKITHIPKVKWSSDSPFNIKPKTKTLFFLFFGLTLFGLGEALLIVSNFGVTPWTVFAEGVAKNFDISIGLATFLVSISILILWVPLKQKIGIGTISNAIIIAFTIDLFVYFLPLSKNTLLSIIEMIIGIGASAIGTSSVTYKSAVFKENDELASAQGFFTHVYVNRTTQKASPISKEFREKLNKIFKP